MLTVQSDNCAMLQSVMRPTDRLVSNIVAEELQPKCYKTGVVTKGNAFHKAYSKK